ncbi:Immediate early protein ICP0, partial [Pyxidicoccus sp. 3LG]
MSSFRITSELARILRSPGSTGPVAVPQGPDAPQAPTRPGQDDNFRTQQPAPTGRPALGGEERGPVKSVEELVPPGLEQVAGQEELAHKFASDAALLAAHLKPSQLSGSERATRLWAFYAAYATAAAAKPPQEEAKQAFREALQGQGFAELRDARTAENGVDR